ncbi:MAG: hypothetical protein Q8P32_03095 [Candidatus Komeilibacteria bacterium]|nr:hypothetical protein [Candidatus Komeilibacteria bacterium]
MQASKWDSLLNKSLTAANKEDAAKLAKKLIQAIIGAEALLNKELTSQEAVEYAIKLALESKFFQVRTWAIKLLATCPGIDVTDCLMEVIYNDLSREAVHRAIDALAIRSAGRLEIDDALQEIADGKHKHLEPMVAERALEKRSLMQSD